MKESSNNSNRKKKVTACVAATGMFILLATGVLGAAMSKAEEETVVSEATTEALLIEKSQDAVETKDTEATTEEAKNDNDGKTVTDADKTELEALTYGNYTICYDKDDNYGKGGELTYEQMLDIAVKQIKNMDQVSISGGTVTVSKGYSSSTPQLLIDSTEVPKCYSYVFETTKNYGFDVSVDAFTGEIRKYSAFLMENASKEEIEKAQVLFDGFTEANYNYGPGKNATDAESHEYYDNKIKELKPTYSEIATDYVEKKLNAGKVSKTYGMLTGSEYKDNDFSRDVMSLYCKLDSGKVIYVSIDQITKKVSGYSIENEDM